MHQQVLPWTGGLRIPWYTPEQDSLAIWSKAEYMLQLHSRQQCRQLSPKNNALEYSEQHCVWESPTARNASPQSLLKILILCKILIYSLITYWFVARSLNMTPTLLSFHVHNTSLLTIGTHPALSPRTSHFAWLNPPISNACSSSLQQLASSTMLFDFMNLAFSDAVCWWNHAALAHLWPAYHMLL